MIRLVCHLVSAALVAVTLSGCASSRRSGPYAPVSETDRDTEKARRLNLQASSLVESEPAKAEKLLREALAADLFSGPAHNNLGVVYLGKGDLFAAAGEFEWARKLLPGLPDPRMNLALTLERAGRVDEALATYATALEVYPGHLPTVEASALLRVRSGKTDDKTPALLDDVALRGETASWRDWARVQRTKLAPP
jgi:Tfp pilus assembly protein PilF